MRQPLAQKQKPPSQKSSADLASSKAVVANHPPHPLLHLQRTLGNQAVLRVLQARRDGLEPTTAQPKPTIDAARDTYEQQADHLAEQVMRMPDPQLQPVCEQAGLKTKHPGPSGSEQTATQSLVHQALASPGQPLDLATRAFMEPRFGYDFSQVRVHTNTGAEQSARAVNAKAYTVGQDLVFGAGHYAPTTIAGRTLLAHELTHTVQSSSGMPVMLQRKPDPAACLAQKDEILPSIGMVGTIDRELTLTDTLGSEYVPLKKTILGDVEARKFVCDSGVPAVLALWDTRTPTGTLDLKAARTALDADKTGLYSKDLDTSWLGRRRIARADKELSDVVSWVRSEEKNTGLPQMLLPILPALQKENVTAAATELDALIPVFESASKQFATAPITAFELRERLDEAKSEAIKAKNPEYIGRPTEALGKAEALAQKLRLELEQANRGIDVGGLVKTSVEVAAAVAKLRLSSATVDSDTIAGVRKAVNTFRKKIVDTQVTDLSSAARRVSFVLRYFAALNTPGFTNAPSTDEIKAMRGHLDTLISDLQLLFGSNALMAFDFLGELGNRIDNQLDQRATMESALGHETALVPPQADALAYFRSLEKKNNAEVNDAYMAYVKAFFEHRIVVKLEDLEVTGLDEIFARPLSLAGVRPLVCTGYAMMGANLLAAAGGKTQEFIVAVRASDEQLRTRKLDDGHAVAVINRKGATFFVSNDLIVHNVNDAIGPEAVAWVHKEFPLISGKGKTVNEATAAMRRKLVRR